MKKLISFLSKNSNGIFATIQDGKPVMRPFQFVMERDGKFYFITSNAKEVYQQLKENGVAGFMVQSKISWARLNGEVQFVDNLELKREVIDNNTLIRRVYKTADNPVLEMFYIHNGFASLHKLGAKSVEKIRI